MSENDRNKLPLYFQQHDDPEGLAIWAAHQLLDAMLEGTVAQSGGIARERAALSSAKGTQG